MRLGAVVAVSVVCLVAAPSLQSGSARPLLTFQLYRVDRAHAFSAICMAWPDGSRRMKIRAGAYDPAWSPDGRRLAFSGASRVPLTHWEDVFVSDARGRNVRLVTRGHPDQGRVNGTPGWSRSGSFVIYASGWGTSQLLATSLRTRATWVVPTGRVGSPRSPDVSPDGRWLLFTGSSPGETKVFMQRLSGRSRRVISHNGDLGVWSPDGRQIAYISPGDPLSGSRSRLIVADRDGGNARVVAEPAFGRPAWSPDGRWIAFTEPATNDPSRSQIAQVRPRGGHKRVVVSLEHYNAVSATWRPAKPLPTGRYPSCP